MPCSGRRPGSSWETWTSRPSPRRWSQRDEAMAARLLARTAAGTRTLVVAGNAHTPTRHSRLGVPLGACLARQRPGVRQIRISYMSGRF